MTVKQLMKLLIILDEANLGKTTVYSITQIESLVDRLANESER